MPRKALVTGITGQDGSYLAEHLLALGYEVHGLVRRVALEDSQRRLGRIAHLLEALVLHPGTLESYGSIFRVFSENSFDECYHLAAQSFVPESFVDGFSTMNANITGTHHVLDLDYRDHVKVDPNLFRPAEVNLLVADPSRARERLKWEPSRSFEELVREMVRSDLESTRRMTVRGGRK
jgi:GDP-D-mannose dehydratase